MENDFARFGVQSSYVNTSNLDEVRSAFRPNTKLVYIESPSNPAMQVTDIEAVSAIAHEHGCIMVVDNTFASPYLQNPLDLGADVVLHSITKFINGHADIVGGVIVAKESGLYKRLRKAMINSGCNMDPHQAFLVLRGLKTLGLRVERAQQSAMRIAEWLVKQPEIASVRYIGLPSHPQHEIAKRQMKGFGSMIAFELKGGFEAGRKLMDCVKVATLAVSLGGIETLIEHPASMTHAGMLPADRITAGFSDGLVRYAVGIEDVEDLIADLLRAFHLHNAKGSLEARFAIREAQGLPLMPLR
jgi:methionine-gamma-lyase